MVGGSSSRPPAPPSRISRRSIRRVCPSPPARLPVLQSHGSEDPVLPFDQAERLGSLFSGAGADHRFLRFAGGHAVPREVIRKARSLVIHAIG
ncbi:MAG: alpha/beta hydrolase [Spirochaetota bacterium]